MKILKFILIITILNSCASNKKIEGKYTSNFADLGFFITTINLKDDKTFEYNFSGDLVNQELTGTYIIDKNLLYLKFSKEKFEIESKNDSLSITEIFSGNYHNYEVQNEKGIQFHRKFKIGNNKLFSYRIDNGKLVKHAKKYSDNKRYLFLGPTSKMKKIFLQKIE
ncbi:hypothetical protein NAL32_19890 [Chryseobacterium sp. Ch-15]|uniref:Uncharacterized protein n=2 Tax=Chryseobacterium TaxID=59732 RepID=A0A9Q3UUR1_9FLAO|nr:hypothetical protein [Chryseobacterium muglaense]MBD3906936.1 hypothetical protein [Chryseobacterium muglaense]MCC9033734.1 hypothetical protein [Chryseobacterium muglaense]MCM2556658.1 hypothetical protein [Chryseobacterium muglaense]